MALKYGFGCTLLKELVWSPLRVPLLVSLVLVVYWRPTRTMLPRMCLDLYNIDCEFFLGDYLDRCVARIDCQNVHTCHLRSRRYIDAPQDVYAGGCVLRCHSEPLLDRIPRLM